MLRVIILCCIIVSPLSCMMTDSLSRDCSKSNNRLKIPKKLMAYVGFLWGSNSQATVYSCNAHVYWKNYADFLKNQGYNQSQALQNIQKVVCMGDEGWLFLKEFFNQRQKFKLNDPKSPYYKFADVATCSSCQVLPDFFET